MPEPVQPLTAGDHRRDRAGLKYVYPVVSRRAGGVSVGINLNTNNACNWACIYCQVPGLQRGAPKPIDLVRLESEFRSFLHELLDGDFMQKNVPEGARRLADVAFSGNGEPTEAAEFPAAVALVAAAMVELIGPPGVPLRLITNGSLLARPAVQAGVRRIGEAGGEVWFKVDRATRAGIRQVNQVSLDPAGIIARLRTCCALAPTRVQTCWFGIDGHPPSAEEENAYLDLLAAVREDIRGVLLYGIARQAMQPGAERLLRLSPEALGEFARKLEARGVEVRVSP